MFTKLYITLLTLSTLLVASCNKETPACTDGNTHVYNKWELDGRQNLAGYKALVRSCTKCGWQQATFEDKL